MHAGKYFLESPPKTTLYRPQTSQPHWEEAGYPPGNDHISPTKASTFESMILRFSHSVGICYLVPWRVITWHILGQPYFLSSFEFSGVLHVTH